MMKRLVGESSGRRPVRRRLGAALVSLLIAGTMAVAVHAPAAHADAAGRGGDFVPLAPSTHLLDTRNGTGGVTGARGSGSTTPITVLGKAGVPASGVSAILVDVTLVSPTAGTFLVLWPDGTPRPAVSMVNGVAGQTISNSAVVPVGANGKIDLFNHAGSTHVTIDVQGYFTQITSGGTGLGGYLPVTTTRLVDTRSGLGAPKATIAANGSLTVTVAGTGPVPLSANAVFLNIVVPSASGGGWLAAFPAGGSSSSSIIDFVPGTTNSGAAVKVGLNGRITITNHSGAGINLVLDAQGYFSASSTEGAGLRTTTARLLDTRSTTALAANATIDVAVGGTNGLPTRAIAGAALNLSEVTATVGGFLRAWPLGDPEPTISHTNFPAGAGRDALAVVRPGVEGKVRIRNVSGSAIQFVVDLEGWFADPLPPVPVERFSRMTAMQGTPAAGASVATLEYAFVNNIGQLVHGHQTDPDNTTSVVYTVISGNDAFTGQPALAEQADGRLQVTAQNSDSNVWVNTQATKSPPAWGSWINRGGSMASRPALARLGDGTLVVFATDLDGRLWAMRQSDPNGAYGSWASLGDADLVGAPTAVVVSDGIRVFALDTSGALKTALYSGGVLSNWTSLGGAGLTGSPAVVVYPGFLLRVFVRGADGTILTKMQDASGVFPATWGPVGTFTSTGSPSAVLSQTGRTEVVARGSDGAIYSTGETAQGSGVWRDWVNVTAAFGMTAATDPSAFNYTSAIGPTWAFVVRDPDNVPWIFTTGQTGALATGTAERTGAASSRAAATGAPTFRAAKLPKPPS